MSMRQGTSFSLLSKQVGSFMSWTPSFFPRLPRRYSNDKGRDNSTPIIGATGSTPLHFACANGHALIVMILLLHGAHSDRPDKHGITPEMLARQNGWVACAATIKEWNFHKDADLREREQPSSPPFADTEDTTPFKPKEPHTYCGSLDCPECSTRKRIRVKRSIDNAVRVLKSHHHASSSVDKQPPSPLGKPLGEYTYYPSPDPRVSQELPPRRPSLPHLHDVPSQGSTASHRRPSNSQSSISSSSRRPRSAGTDAEPSPSSQRLKGKISLLSIFKKNSNEVYGTPDSQSGSSSVFTSHSPSPAPDMRSVPTGLANTPQSRSTDYLAATPPDSSPLNGYGTARSRYRLASTGESGRQSPLQAVELHNAFSRESLQAQYNTTLSTGEFGTTYGTRSPPSRPGILRAHGRSSSGQSQMQSQPDSMRSLNHSMAPASSGQSSRSLRFDSSSTTSTSYSRRPSENRRDHRHESRSPARRVRGSESKTSLRSRSPGSPWGIIGRESDDFPPTQTISLIPLSAESTNPVPRNGDGIEEEEEEEYGNPIEPLVGMGNLTLQGRQLHASPELSVSDLASDHTHTQEAQSASNSQPRVFECPFSINRPPVTTDEEPAEVHTRPNLLGIDGIDGRTRGDSLSSMNTNPTSSSSASAYLGTPAVSSLNLPTPAVYSPPSNLPDLPYSPIERDMLTRGAAGTEFGVVANSPKRPRVPLDIDIRSISSHAQAEALVQQAQQRIFDLQNELDSEKTNALGVSVGEGRTPLSARLAAYGESLAIERKFKEEEERKRSPRATSTIGATSSAPPTSNSRGASVARPSALKGSRSARGLDRTWSLGDGSRVHDRQGRVQKVRRPHTSGGTRKFCLFVKLGLKAR